MLLPVIYSPILIPLAVLLAVALVASVVWGGYIIVLISVYLLVLPVALLPALIATTRRYGIRPSVHQRRQMTEEAFQ